MQNAGGLGLSVSSDTRVDKARNGEDRKNMIRPNIFFITASTPLQKSSALSVRQRFVAQR